MSSMLIRLPPAPSCLPTLGPLSESAFLFATLIILRPQKWRDLRFLCGA